MSKCINENYINFEGQELSIYYVYQHINSLLSSDKPHENSFDIKSYPYRNSFDS
jgi:hypothetical protein